MDFRDAGAVSFDFNPRSFKYKQKVIHKRMLEDTMIDEGQWQALFNIIVSELSDDFEGDYILPISKADIVIFRIPKGLLGI